MGSGSSYTVGFRYYFGIHMGLNLGECDEIVEIKVADRTAWSGSITTNDSVFINAPELFGGDKAEGGIVGTLDVMMGGPDQPVNPRLEAMLGGLVPAFRGKTTLFYDGQVSAMNPYPKPWSVRRRRNLKGWDGPVWYPEKAVIELAGGTIKAANPAHIIWQLHTNRRYGMGLPSTRMNADSFAAAADALYDEGFGLCLRWTRQDTIANFEQIVLDHIGAVIDEDPMDGTIVLRLIRDDYDPDDLPHFTYGTGLLSIEDDDNGSQASGTNQVIVTFKRPQDNSKGSVRVQNLASIRQFGKQSTTIDYPGIPTPELALRVAQRDLIANSGFLKRFKCRFDRRVYQIRPGMCFRISDPRRGIANIVLRAGRVEEGESGDGRILITAVQDVFSLPSTSFVEPQPSAWTPPDRTPQPITTRRLIEAPYWDLVRSIDQANLALVPDTAGYLLTLAERPTGLSRDYDITTRVGPSGAFTTRDTGAFTPTGTLAAELSITGTSATIEDGVDLDIVRAGTAALVDDEILRIDTIDAATGEITFARGCLDTVRAAHASGARVWFFDEYLGEDPTEYSDGNTVHAQLLTNTGQGKLSAGLAGTDNITMDQRQFRPYPPGRLRVNDAAYPASISGDLVVSWAHRDRITQADQLVDDSVSSIGPEDGVTYTLRIYDGESLVRTESEINGTSYTYESATEIGDGGPFDPIRFTLHAVRDGLESLQGHDWTVSRT